MQKLSEEKILEAIAAGELFECEAEDGSFTLRVQDYTPAIHTAVHNGSAFPESLQKQCLLSTEERLYEEDPYTADLIEAMPITLIGNDSRYFYDLNRPIATCIYKRAWGKQVWQKAPTSRQRQDSLTRHRRFYRILDALISKVEQRFGACLVFDIHSYNGQRIEGDAPAFNIGTEQIDMDRWSRVVERFRKGLSRIQHEGQPVTAALNRVFHGRGYLIGHVNSRFENTLVLPCEVRKLFMDELSGTVYPLLLNDLKAGLKECFTDTGAYFSRQYTRRSRTRQPDMLSSQLDPVISKVDRELYRLARGLETLYYINPVNLQQEKRKFFARLGSYSPQFSYKPLEIDPYLFRERLYRLPVDKIRDPGIQLMYGQVVDSLSGKIDLLISAGSSQFVYNSLKYYGEPSLVDEANARFLLHAAAYSDTSNETVGLDEAIDYFHSHARRWQMDCRIEVSSKIVASAMVSNSRKTLYINRNSSFSRNELKALAHHELGVHMSTTLNAAQQPLKVFSLGLPGNTMTQEGLAILNEFHSGSLSLERLQGLALRVLAVKEMLAHDNFRHTFFYLHEEMKMGREAAFKLTARVHRAGGFTKDYLYLRGLSEALRLYQEGDISNLYIGKTSFSYLGLLDELVAREIIHKPSYVPETLRQPEPVSDILGYLVSSIRPTVPVAMAGSLANGQRAVA
ncbi:flavohemoglobin expression-modulating QEGLA motif protein [Neptuniibacter halophilus]|uniref:flavohemoglobin expression-modulating QEGLA motif protein n=1 Tax=Neptuniibacter halophilus TaxID=651666 RepID=UPI0025722E65|nr:flavohemoglobin expression-modulating QEGLA motif protein [Neptuniibacter halophilus]